MTGIFLFFNRTRSVFLEYFDDRGRSKEVPTRGLPEDGHRARPQPQPNRDGVTSMQSNSSDPKRYLSRYRHNSGLIDRSKVGPYNAKQRIVSLDELDSGKVVYPVDLIPHATHPRVLATIAEDPALLDGSSTPRSTGSTGSRRTWSIASSTMSSSTSRTVLTASSSPT
jgi:hypothetical protein